MGNIFSFQDYTPVVHESSFVHPNATIVGNVIIGANVYIGPSAAIRGDWGEIVIEDGCNVQECCVVHMFPGITVRLEEGAHIGHGAVIHGAHIGKNVLVGMNSVIMDNARIGDNSIIGALTMVAHGMEIPERKIVVGNPAKVVKDVSDEMLEWKSQGTELYQKLPAQCAEQMKAVEPLRSVPKNRVPQKKVYKTWQETVETGDITNDETK